MTRRKTTDDERALFRKMIEHPIKAVTRKTKAKPATARSAKSTELDGSTAARLKRGAQNPQARLDLHGQNESAAHGALLDFLGAAHKKGLRLVLVITGMGNPEREAAAAWAMRSHGVLKEMVPRWLKEKDFAALASGCGPAHRRHGGDGALYVYLRKNI